MNILVLNGSPKGQYSITLQTPLYLEVKRPKHSFKVIHVGQRVRALEKDFSEIKEAVEWADLLVFSYPVYTFIAPSQLHKFIELLKASDVAVAGKYATQITTSKHFYDVTAHRYIQDNCQDMGMKFIRGLSADMDDLTMPKGQKEALAFFDHVIWQMKKGICEPGPVPQAPARHMAVTVPGGGTAAEASGSADATVSAEAKPAEAAESGEQAAVQNRHESGAAEPAAVPDKPGDVVIVTDCAPGDTQLADMIARFRAVLPLASRIVNLREYPFKGGCLGCFHCATSGKCVYIDGFDEYLRNHIQTAQAIVYAFSIQDHSMGPVFKMYDDRQFCNGHRTVTMGMPMGYLVSGNYSQEFNLQMIVEGRAQVGGNYLAGVATDETDPDHAIDQMAANLTYAVRRRYAEPQNFYGVGGMKIFRDLIYLMQGMMKADHQFYKAHGQYDFPQKKKGTVAKMYLVGALLSQPAVMKKMGNQMNEGMLMPYKKVIERAKTGTAPKQAKK